MPGLHLSQLHIEDMSHLKKILTHCLINTPTLSSSYSQIHIEYGTALSPVNTGSGQPVYDAPQVNIIAGPEYRAFETAIIFTEMKVRAFKNIPAQTKAYHVHYSLPCPLFD